MDVPVQLRARRNQSGARPGEWVLRGLVGTRTWRELSATEAASGCHGGLQANAAPKPWRGECRQPRAVGQHSAGVAAPWWLAQGSVNTLSPTRPGHLCCRAPDSASRRSCQGTQPSQRSGVNSSLGALSLAGSPRPAPNSFLQPGQGCTHHG